MRILVVQNETLPSRDVRDELTAMGHEVVAHDAADAARVARQLGAELIVLQPAQGEAELRAQIGVLRAMATGLPAPQSPTSRSGTFRIEHPRALTTREAEVFELLAQGARIAEIGQRLFISPHTVRKHAKAIFRKLGVHSQVELMREHRVRARRNTPIGGSF